MISKIVGSGFFSSTSYSSRTCGTIDLGNLILS